MLINVDHQLVHNIDDLVLQLLAYLRPGDNVLILSNGGFEGFCSRLITALQAKSSQ